MDKRRSDEERLAALQRRIAALKDRQRALNQRLSAKERKARAHVGIVAGWGIIDHAAAHPESEVMRVLIRVLEDHHRTRPDDKPVVELLARLKAPAANREAAE
jgi:hypothetical protein